MAGKTKAKKSGDPRKVDRNNMDSMSIDDYLNDIAYVYKTWDGKRSVIDHWLHLLRHASKLAEVVRRQEAGSIVKEWGEVFIWMLSFVKELKEPKVKEDGIFYICD